MAALSGRAHRRHPVSVEEDVGALRRAVSEVASRSGKAAVGDVALVATELATNLLRHTTSGGYVLYRETPAGIELLAVDRGPGMARSDVATTGATHGSQRRSGGAPGPAAGGLGVGLAGVKRHSTTFDLYSTKPEGTVILTHLGAASQESEWCRWGAVNVPFGGDGDSGDGWGVSVDGTLAAVVVDGLGHGAAAADAARAALSVFGRSGADDPVAFIAAAHEEMRRTRGGVLGACAIRPDLDQLSYAGVGNIASRLLEGAGSQSLVNRDGSVGTHLGVPTTKARHYHWGPGATLVMATDGLRSGWDPRSYPGLLRHHPAVVAAVLERDFGRGTDDAAVLVIQDLRRESR